jgi:hypothetical protein
MVGDAGPACNLYDGSIFWSNLERARVAAAIAQAAAETQPQGTLAENRSFIVLATFAHANRGLKKEFS